MSRFRLRVSCLGCGALWWMRGFRRQGASRDGAVKEPRDVLYRGLGLAIRNSRLEGLVAP